MFLGVYIFLAAVIVIHVVYWLRRMFQRPRTSWDHDRNGALALVMLLLIAGTNAAHTFFPNLLPRPSTVMQTFFGLGRTEGALQLGIAGIYWVIVGLFSVAVLFSSKRADHAEVVKLPPGGLWTLWGYMALLVLLVGLIFWGLR